MRLTGKAAIVTGGASGIGRATVLRFVAEGCRVVVADVDEGRGMAVVEGITAKGGDSVFFRHDVTSEADWERLAERTMSTYGRVDVLFNNAGIELAKSLADTSLEDWERVMSVNVTGPFLGMKHIVPLMVRQGGGSVINMSSSSGLVGCGCFMAYTASKGAVRLMTKDAAIEFASVGVRVNSVHPGYVDTEMMGRIAGDWSQSEAEVTAAAVPLGRLGAPEEIAGLVAFLASDESAYCTGAEFVMDGGETAR
jgi:NAD(P)-dependent dehydrogenase (short-subunit alcohol dehydrogenase family)